MQGSVDGNKKQKKKKSRAHVWYLQNVARGRVADVTFEFILRVHVLDGRHRLEEIITGGALVRVTVTREHPALHTFHDLHEHGSPVWCITWVRVEEGVVETHPGLGVDDLHRDGTAAGVQVWSTQVCRESVVKMSEL